MADNDKQATITATIKQLQELLNSLNDGGKTEAAKACNNVDIYFTEREIGKLPKPVRQWLRAKNGVMNARKRSDRRLFVLMNCVIIAKVIVYPPPQLLFMS